MLPGKFVLTKSHDSGKNTQDMTILSNGCFITQTNVLYYGMSLFDRAPELLSYKNACHSRFSVCLMDIKDENINHSSFFLFICTVFLHSNFILTRLWFLHTFVEALILINASFLIIVDCVVKHYATYIIG